MNSVDCPIVLIIDDDRTMRLAARHAFEGMGAQVEEAEDGPTGIKAFEKVKPHLVLLDVRMPGMDGFSTCRNIRQIPHGQQTPIVVMTGLDDLESIDLAYEAGATDFVTKPVQWIILRERVRYMIRAGAAFESAVRNETKNRALLQALPDLIFQLDSGGRFLDYKVGRDQSPLVAPQDFLGRKITEVLPARVAEPCVKVLQETLKTGNLQDLQYPLHVNGTVTEHEARFVPCGENEVLAVVRDVTDQRRQARALQRERDFVAKILDTANALVLVRNRQGQIVRFNRACEDLTGYCSQEVERKAIWDLFVPEEHAEREKTVYESLIAGQIIPEYEGTWSSKKGDVHAIRWANSTLPSDRGEVEYVISIGIDVTEQRRAERRIQFLAYYDDLTSLPNRVLFRQKLDHALAFSERYHRQMAVMFLDIDQFKQINDTLGHSQGDIVLKTVADRLSASLRKTDSVARQAPSPPRASIARFGGDEFTILVTELSSPQSAAQVAERLLKNFDEPFQLNGQEVRLTGSIGISLYPYDGTDADTLLRNADVAMYHSKDTSRNNYQFFSGEMHSATSRRLTLESELHRALQEEEFELHYQPKFDLTLGKIVGVEALIRWRHPENGLLLPGEFIQVAENSRLILPLGNWVLQKAAAQNVAWQRQGYSPVDVAVNLSSRQFRQADVLDTIMSVLEKTHLDPARLELEITEGTIVQQEEQTVATLNDIRALGVKVAIDDFGTGYSSLSYLKKFPVTSLKIDRSFVKDIVTDPDDLAITRAVIAMGHHLNLRVVAEGVETPEQLDCLRREGCDEIQGFLLCRPVPASEIEPLLSAPEPFAFCGLK